MNKVKAISATNLDSAGKKNKFVFFLDVITTETRSNSEPIQQFLKTIQHWCN